MLCKPGLKLKSSSSSIIVINAGFGIWGLGDQMQVVVCL
jgi:hypothetical protein